ncbi:MAG: hypothetical protein HKN92_07395 [Chitinophagales bacterium]|nr:hypothetical protein [Chitinophagales bacterium]
MDIEVRTSLNEDKKGFYIGDRLILPFKCHIIKIIAGHNIFTEMVGSNHIKISQEPHNTSIYFRSGGKLANYLNPEKTVKMVVCDLNKELTEIGNHIKLIIEIEENHKVTIHEPSDDMIFIE